ncbi:MAG: hypothetical protein BWY78_00726 [Alphaproteobacteria bacterium ADurb.Bin438]|nr:MAG: hypothetical protein BWY78_00726 [Alphaproteobacteria bacterium ADurb.Bin438]
MLLTENEIQDKYETKNLTSLFLWLFSLVWILISLSFIYIYLRDFESLDDIVKIILPIMTSVGTIVLLQLSLSSFISTTLINKNKIIIKQIFLYKINEKKISPNEIEKIFIENTKDDEGDNYFKIILNIKSKETFVIKESHSKEYLLEEIQKIKMFLSKSIFE